jgi:cysteine desulfurase
VPVYLDHNASTPLDERVLEAMLPFLACGCGNPSSIHGWGRAMRAAIEHAREQVAALVGARASQVVFTSGGTEANNLAIKGLAQGDAPGRIAIGSTEHASVAVPARALGRLGWSVDEVGVDRAGRISLSSLDTALTPHTRVVAVMMANNETGVIQDIAALATAVRGHGAVLHTDAVQAVGKIPVDFAALGVHSMSLSAHKLNGPQGVGALVVDGAVDVFAQLLGGGQERGLRSGTENVAGIVGFGKAAELAEQELEARRDAMQTLRRKLETLLATVAGAVVFGADVERLPNTVMFALPGIDSEALLLGLDRAGFAVSSGSACASQRKGAAHVLDAMGVPPALAQAAIRVSFGRGNTATEVDAFVTALHEQRAQLRSMAAAWTS